MNDPLLVLIVASLGCFVAMGLVWIADVWLPRVQRNRTRRLARRQDVVDMARYRAVRRIGGQL